MLEYSPPSRHKLMIVDDSRMIRRILTDIFNRSKKFQIIGEASNGEEALEMVQRLNPDLISLDVNMPVMDGLTALKHIMIQHPTPTLMVSSLTKHGSNITFDSFKYGAVDFIQKPSNINGLELAEQEEAIIHKAVLAAEIKVDQVQYLRSLKKQTCTFSQDLGCEAVVAMGTSVGGFGALIKIIPRIRADLKAAFVVTLDEAPSHVEAFARYLDTHSPTQVTRAIDGVLVRQGHCYLASSTEHVTFNSFGRDLLLQVNPNPFSNRNEATTILLNSLAESQGQSSVGVILSGTGKDGTEGLKAIVRHGGTAMVQDPQTCLGKEMPQSAINGCQVEHVVAGSQLAMKLNQLLSQT